MFNVKPNSSLLMKKYVCIWNIIYRIFKGGYDVPKENVVFINRYAVHQDPKRLQYHDKFDPFWYLDEMGKVDPVKLESMLSFWTGIRVCLGKWLIQAEISLICVIFGNVFRFCFRWTRNKSLRENTEFSLVQKNHSTWKLL